MADFGGLEYALVDGLVFDTTAGTYDSGTLEAALADEWVLVAQAVAAGHPALRRLGLFDTGFGFDRSRETRWG